MNYMFKYLAQIRLLFISILLISIFNVSCKNETKLPEYNIEELKRRELDSVRNLLTLSRDLIQKDDYEASIKYLTIIINNYATYKEVLVARNLFKEANRKLLLKKIYSASNIDTLIVITNSSLDSELREKSKKKINELITGSDDIKTIKDYLNKDDFLEFESEAKERLAFLKEKEKENAYKNALSSQSSNIWKKFLKDYPNHPEKNRIEDQITALEVEEIFNGEYGEIPSSQLLGEKNYKKSSIEIKNDTRYTLTIRYSGNEVKKIVIAPNSFKKITLKSGQYKVAASVNASGVRNFAGRETLQGEYSSSYYIKSSKY